MHKKIKKCLVILSIIFLSEVFVSNIFARDAYKIDSSHSTIGFAVKHMGVGITHGVFTDYTGEVEFDEENPDAFKAWVIIKTQSIDTHLEARDKNLKNADFLDVENYPTIIFVARKLYKKGNHYQIAGDLTMRGVTKEISGSVYIRGPVNSPFGGQIIGISGEIVVNRQDYGISWNDVMPDGGFVVGNDVEIIIDIEADKK